jgi:hypothetical protein
LNKSSSDGPSSSITITLYSPSKPHHFTCGIPTPGCKVLYNFASMCSCGCFVFTHSNLIATSSRVRTFSPKIYDYFSMMIKELYIRLDNNFTKSSGLLKNFSPSNPRPSSKRLRSSMSKKLSRNVILPDFQ